MRANSQQPTANSFDRTFNFIFMNETQSKKKARSRLDSNTAAAKKNFRENTIKTPSGTRNYNQKPHTKGTD